jgi:hypothetical protein
MRFVIYVRTEVFAIMPGYSGKVEIFGLRSVTAVGFAADVAVGVVGARRTLHRPPQELGIGFWALRVWMGLAVGSARRLWKTGWDAVGGRT